MRIWAAVAALGVMGVTSLPQTAQAQSSVIVIGGAVNPETCVSRTSFFTRKRYGNTIETRENYRFTNRCKTPVKHYVCQIPPDQTGCTRAGDFQLRALPKGKSYDPFTQGGRVMVAFACKADEGLFDWPGGGRPRCTLPGTVPVADTGYRGTGMPPNRDAPRATLTNARNVTEGMVYPPELKGKRISTSVTVAVGVNAAGRATGCVVVQTSGFRELDSLTCDLFMRRARFNPALGGAAERVYLSGPISWIDN